MTILYMVVYGHLIDPGHEQAYYDAHVRMAAPYCSIVAGIPLMFLAGWWVAGWDVTLAVRSALVIWLTYAVIDVAASVAAGLTSVLTVRLGVLIAISILTKLAAGYSGAQVRT
jgi:hypothetical protein